MRYWVFVSSRACLYQGDSSQRALLTVRGAFEVHLRWWFYWWHQVTHRPLRRCYAGCLARVAGERERRGVNAKGKGGGGVRGHTGTQRGHSVSPRAACRHLHLGRSIPWHKQLRVPLEDRIYWFWTGVNRRSRYLWYSPLKSALFMLLKQNCSNPIRDSPIPVTL